MAAQSSYARFPFIEIGCSQQLILKRFLNLQELSIVSASQGGIPQPESSSFTTSWRKLLEEVEYSIGCGNIPGIC